uniref:Beta-amylase n=1 Tax=Noccaea caerulescens TaxID=107243 RepID=A0A1J3FCW7_NOCCA
MLLGAQSLKGDEVSICSRFMLKALTVSLKTLKLAGVHGVAVEVWWGIVERFYLLEFKWSLYEELFRLVSQAGLKLHVALCFHSNMHLFVGKGGIS